uniref:Ig-like domain-containing protein n=1 Tax=Oreochromis aureus TaxID=47969 RepID=A0AAZ1XWI5_OREAU
MSGVTASLCSTLLFLGVFVLVSADQKLITAESGQDVTLPCQAPNNNNKIIVLEWSRADLGDKKIIFYRDGKFVPAIQHPSFKNRVDLQDRQMKDGDVSLILKDVTINDAGTYECRVYVEGTQSWQLSSIELRVHPPDQKLITAESGQDVTLPCRAPNNNNKIIVLEWSRAELGDKNILLYRNGKFAPATQHPSFKNRVDLQDRQMKDGDVSLILNNVTINYTGTYECHVYMEETSSWKSISFIYLHVVPPGQTGGDTEDGSVGLIAGLSFSAVLLVAAVVGFLIYRRRKLNPSDPDEAEHLQPECESDEQTQKT